MSRTRSWSRSRGGVRWGKRSKIGLTSRTRRVSMTRIVRTRRWGSMRRGRSRRRRNGVGNVRGDGRSVGGSGKERRLGLFFVEKVLHTGL